MSAGSSRRACGQVSGGGEAYTCTLTEGHAGLHTFGRDTDERTKPRFELIDPHALEEIAKVFTIGAETYPDFGWRERVVADGGVASVIGSLSRHLNAIQRGEDRDPHSGLSHAAHIASRAMMLSYELRMRSTQGSTE